MAHDGSVTAHEGSATTHEGSWMADATSWVAHEGSWLAWEGPWMARAGSPGYSIPKRLSRVNPASPPAASRASIHQNISCSP